MSFELTPIPVNDDILDTVASGSYYSPHSVLGAHLGDDGVTIRVVAHLADAVDIITPTGAYAASHERGGIWVAALPDKELRYGKIVRRRVLLHHHGSITLPFTV